MPMSSEIAGAIEEEGHLILPSDLISSTKPLSNGISQVPKSPSESITLYQRMISACSGSLLTCLVVTPFDVVRVRLHQQQLLYPTKVKATDQCCRTVFWNQETEGQLKDSKSTSSPEASRNTLESMKTKPFVSNRLPSSSNPVVEEFCATQHSCAQETKIRGTFEGLVKISANEGVCTLYRGLSLTLIMAVPSNIVYFSGYEYLKEKAIFGTNAIWNPLICGSIARALAATVISPLELIRTRMQVVPTKSKVKSSEVMRMVFKNSIKEIREKGIMTIFKGLQLTLWRDVPFSGIYWASYEYLSKTLKDQLNVDPSSTDLTWKLFTSSFLGGSSAGVIAALVTNPFDVGKTRMQVTLSDSKKVAKKENMFKFLADIAKNEGLGAFYVGIVPRCMKIAPACAIMISTYELGKKFFARMN